MPHSSMASWVQGSEKVVMIDGCFLQCHGRVLKKLVPEERILHFDALPLHKKYTDIFLMDDVPEEDRKAVAREVADKIRPALEEAGLAPRPEGEGIPVACCPDRNAGGQRCRQPTQSGS